MDNNMAAVVSAMMIALGFVNGMLVCSFINSFRTAHLNSMLDKAIDLKFDADKRIDDLEHELSQEKKEKKRLLSALRTVVSEYSDLPPPEGPAVRSNHYCESDSEDGDFECPTSPDLNPNNKE
jgi:hypothetical protein